MRQENTEVEKASVDRYTGKVYIQVNGKKINIRKEVDLKKYMSSEFEKSLQEKLLKLTI